MIPPSDAADEPANDFGRVNVINLRGVWGCLKHTSEPPTKAQQPSTSRLQEVGRVKVASETSFESSSGETALDAVNCGDPAATVGLGERVVVPLVLIGVGEGEPKDRALELVAPADVARDGR